MRKISYRESLHKTINLREKLDVYIVSHWYGTTHPAWPAQGQRLTPGQALSEYEKSCKQTDSPWVALKAVSRDGIVYDISALRNAINYTRSARLRNGCSGFSRNDDNKLTA